MKKLLLLSISFIALFSCNKDKKRGEATYNLAVEGMGFRYDKAYTFYFQRSTALGTTTDSDFVIFRSNGVVTEVANRFDSGSYLYPDTLNYVPNTSYDANIYWNQYPGVTLMNFYPLYDGKRGYLLHDYLNASVVSVFKSSGTGVYNQVRVFPTVKDSIASVTGYVK